MEKGKKRGFIQYIVITTVILAVVFLSQQPYFRPLGKNLVSWATEKSNLYWSNANDWFKASLYPRLSMEAAKRGEPLKEEVITQKDNAAKNIWENIKSFFAEKFSNFSGTKVE